MLTIGELASYAGVTVRAVRHYHAKGLLPEPERDRSATADTTPAQWWS
ncbi:MerR family transcriptional regulator [Nonomuraea sp. B10E15]